MNKIQNPKCPHCNGKMKPIFSVKSTECQPGTPPRIELYISGYECDGCGHQTSKDDTIDS